VNTLRSNNDEGTAIIELKILTYTNIQMI